MKIKFLTRSASAFGNFICDEIADLPPAFAMSVVKGGFAELVDAPEPETTTIEPVQETAVIKTPKRKAGRPRKKK